MNKTPGSRIRGPFLAFLLATAACGFRGTNYLGDEPKPSGIGCSSIQLNNNGYSVFGKNLDNSYTTHGLILINKRGVERISPHVSTTGRRARWISKYSSVNFSFVHVGFVWTGMNEKGLVISMMGIPETEGPPPDVRPPLVDGLWIQYMLDTCTTVEEVLAAAKNVRILTVDHYHIADSTGDSAVLEFLNGEEIVYTGDDLPISVLTNSTYGASILDWNYRHKYGFHPPNGSLERFRIAAERIEGFAPTDDMDSAVEYAFETLDDIRSETIYGYPYTTEWSFVFDTKRLRAYFKTLSHKETKYFDLLDFDSSCHTPVQMLRVQSNLSGDVHSFFEDVTFEAACEHYRHFKESFQRQSPSQPEIEEEVRYYMSFQCVDDGQGTLGYQ